MSRRWFFGFAGVLGLIASVGPLSRPARADDAPQLRYGFQTDQEYYYEIKIHTKFPTGEVTNEGIYSYKISEASDSQFTLRAVGSLKTHATGRVSASSGRMHIPGPPPRPTLPSHVPGRRGGPPGRTVRAVEPTRPDGTTFDRQGNIVSEGKLDFLAMPVGFAETLILEPLAAEAKASWDTQTGAAGDHAWHHLGPFSEAAIAQGAQERIECNVLDTKPGAVRVGKKYTLKFSVESDGGYKFDVSGSGEFLFDRTAGVIKSQTMKYDVQFNHNNVSAKIPVTLSYRLATAEEAAAYKKKTGDELAARRAAVKARTETAKQATSSLAPAAHGAQTRTWHDATGTYAIEATLVKSADGQVTLKRTDGREMTLPLEKLSEEDRAFISKAAKPANPFE